MNPFARIADFFRLPRPAEDPECRRQIKWTRRFEAQGVPRHALVLDQARRTYATFRDNFDVLDRKAGQVLQTAAVVGAILATGVGAMGIRFSGLLFVTMSLLVSSVFVALWSRQPLALSGESSARTILDADGADLDSAVFDVWLAASLHRTSEEIRVVNDWKARRIREATWLLFVGLVSLIAALWFMCRWSFAC